MPTLIEAAKSERMMHTLAALFIIVAVLLMVLPRHTTAAPASRAMSCDAVSFSSGMRTGTHIHADAGEKGAIFQYLSVDRDRCTQAVIVGKVSYTDAEDDIAWMSETAHAYIREQTPGIDRGLVVRRGGGGKIEHAYRVDGARAGTWAGLTPCDGRDVRAPLPAFEEIIACEHSDD